MSCSERNKGGEEGKHEQPVICNSIASSPKLLEPNGSISTLQFSVDENLLVDPKLLFIGSEIGEGAHGKVYEGRSVLLVLKVGLIFVDSNFSV